MPFVYLSLGSNLGRKESNLKKALREMKTRNFWIKQVSSVYKTEPVGKTDQAWFFNMCAIVDTRYPPDILLNKLQEIELACGRDRSQEREKWGPRTIDIDILFFEDVILDTPNLKIPHPLMHERRFVLVPLNEIAPLFTHPVLKKTVHRLLMECPDASIVEPFSRMALKKNY
ncbi:2-amino-4-hydroxy-6-hydroxymethyldihydropteridine diphosphokinase [Candidatus Peregrinibacteria bacterium]|nr:2-amino-4-hydroxy-6-hydroxymethyldihydropteridine diphosphokinase [Candidatus Peregrinibacteria bacterium]